MNKARIAALVLESWMPQTLSTNILRNELGHISIEVYLSYASDCLLICTNLEGILVLEDHLQPVRVILLIVLNLISIGIPILINGF